MPAVGLDHSHPMATKVAMATTILGFTIWGLASMERAETARFVYHSLKLPETAGFVHHSRRKWVARWDPFSRNVLKICSRSIILH